ncbi:MAG TPA: hypothetical protein VMH81_18040 [Bryobacteraceae bacterium]|nr:hypothetical protein [Bryobacteraceae bacterium]
MRFAYVGLAVALATAGWADTIVLKNGRVINGTYLGGTAREIRVDLGDRIETLDVANVSRIDFGGGGGGGGGMQSDGRRPTLHRAPGSDSTSDDRPTIRRADSSDNSDPDRPVLRRADNTGSATIMRPDNPDTGASVRPAPAPAPTRTPVELPAGTNFVVRMIDGVDSETAHVGQTFKASMDSGVTGPNGDTVIFRGADVVVKLVDAKESGKFTGKAELTLMLVSVKVDDRMVDLNTQTISRESSSRGEKTAKVAGGAAVAGAVLGGILGGGKGAVGGAAAGGAAGAGVEAITKGQQVKVPSETRLTFVLDSPVSI